jgi:nucleoside-diphosphate-sugar epimerase
MRINSQEINERRKAKTSTFFITGATGFLGSHIAVELLKKGYRVMLLVRPGQERSAIDRVRSLFKWFGINDDKKLNYTVIEGRIDKPRFGLSHEHFQELKKNIDEFFHCAASTDFKEKNREQAERINVNSLSYVFDFLDNSSCHFFHHISTAYIAGKNRINCQEKIIEQNHFMNVYEETKYQAEVLIDGYCQRKNIRLNIYRPSIVYGDSETGRATKFNALYFPVKTFLFLKDIFTNDIKNNQGKRAEKMGIKIEKDGSFFIPLRIETGNNEHINIIPVNFFINEFISIFNHSLAGGIYNIVSTTPAKIQDIILYVKKMFKVKGLTAVDKQSFMANPPTPLERMFHDFLEIYLPYMKDRRKFDNQNNAKILAENKKSCPVFSYQIFKICMKYAIKTNWGKTINI